MAVVGQASLIQSCAPHPSRRHSGMVSVLCVRVVARCLLHVSCVSIWVSRELAGVDSLCGGSAICVMHREIRANIAQYSKIFRALRARQMSRSISRYVCDTPSNEPSPHFRWSLCYILVPRYVAHKGGVCGRVWTCPGGEGAGCGERPCETVTRRGSDWL